MPKLNSYTSSFSTFLFRILLPYIVVLAVVGWLFDYGFKRAVIMNSQISGAYKVERIVNELHPDEIPIFGSSRAEGGLIPDSLGANFFNYGLSGTKTDVANFLLAEECKKKKSLPWIIVNLDLTGIEHGLGNIANYIPNCNNSGVRELIGADYRRYYSLPFFRYYGQYEGYIKNYLNNKMQLTKFSNKGAAIEKNVLPPKQMAEMIALRRGIAQPFMRDAALESQVFELINMHSERYFIFVIAPYHRSFFSNSANIEAAEDFIGKVNECKNAHVFDFSHMELPDSMYFNTSHLNLKGAVVFCRSFRDSLSSIGVK